LVLGLTGAVILAVALGVLFGRQAGYLAAGLGGPPLFSGLLGVLLPLLLVASHADDHGARRSGAPFATILGLAARLVTMNRSAWLGTAVGVLVLGGLAMKYMGGQGRLLRNKHQIVLPVLLVVGAIGAFFFLSGFGSALHSRMETLAQPGSQASAIWRMDHAKAAWKMFLSRPLEGWGPGSYAVFAAYLGAPAFPTLAKLMPGLDN